jgi:hypothetical protein
MLIEFALSNAPKVSTRLLRISVNVQSRDTSSALPPQRHVFFEHIVYHCREYHYFI